MSELTAAEWATTKKRHGRRAERFDVERTARLIACKPRKAQPLDPPNRDVCREMAKSTMLPSAPGLDDEQKTAHRKARNRLKATRRSHRA